MAERLSPRLLTRANLRLHLGNMAWAQIKVRMKAGKVPRPMWGVDADAPEARWDRRAVDRALDDASAIPGSIERETEMLDRYLGTG